MQVGQSAREASSLKIIPSERQPPECQVTPTAQPDLQVPKVYGISPGSHFCVGQGASEASSLTIAPHPNMRGNFGGFMIQVITTKTAKTEYINANTHRG